MDTSIKPLRVSSRILRDVLFHRVVTRFIALVAFFIAPLGPPSLRGNAKLLNRCSYRVATSPRKYARRLTTDRSILLFLFSPPLSLSFFSLLTHRPKAISFKLPRFLRDKFDPRDKWERLSKRNPLVVKGRPNEGG